MRQLGEPRPIKKRSRLTCVCCGTQYEAGSWACCAAHPGQSSSAWLNSWCEQGDGDNHIRHCPRHTDGCVVCSATPAPVPIPETKRQVQQIRSRAASGVRSSEAASDQGWER
jgi:hypothetical protein